MYNPDMEVKIKKITTATFDTYYKLFSDHFGSQFPHYSPIVADHLLAKPWSKRSFAQLLQNKKIY